MAGLRGKAAVEYVEVNMLIIKLHILTFSMTFKLEMHIAHTQACTHTHMHTHARV